MCLLNYLLELGLVDPMFLYWGKQGGKRLWGWPWAGGGAGACLPLLCPPPRVKAKVIPQPLWEAGLAGEEDLDRQRAGALGSWMLRGTHLGPRQSWLREGQQTPLWPWSHPPAGPASPPYTNPCGSQSHTEAWGGLELGGGRETEAQRGDRGRVGSRIEAQPQGSQHCPGGTSPSFPLPA